MILANAVTGTLPKVTPQSASPGLGQVALDTPAAAIDHFVLGRRSALLVRLLGECGPHLFDAG